MEKDVKTYTTDGQDLAEKAEELKKSGFDRVAVKVNTFNYTRYKQSNGGKELQPVIDGINRAVGQKLSVRLDVGIEEGFNDDEVLDFLQLTFQHSYDIVFLPTISYDFLRSKMPALRKAGEDLEDAEMFKYPGAVGRIGFLKE
ncbi:MAG TPA: hypothetical protein IAC50_01945 [Candidatus Copromorpha excrementigallinarum]|uniref:Radical SAM core domain-containing protein n=1 Tax=Candidatus Allocopromorpha excrementigallinarum TaxID=2840742 RepID=A0A9D1I1L6_9FIRM|nr:hypothetical protein [Candidatus Copromorpha excrementigallinarum]